MAFTSSAWFDLWIILTVMLFVIHVVNLKSKRRWLIFDPLNFFWAGVFVIYILEPISNYNAYVSWYGEGVVQDSLQWIFFGLLFVHLGYRLKSGRRLAARLPALPPRLSPNGLFGAALVLIAAGLLGWKLTFDTAGGFSAWAAVSRGGADWEKLSGYTTALASLLAVGISLFVFQVELYRKRGLTRMLAWLALSLLLLFFLYLGTRSRTILVVLVALMAWSLPRRRNPSMTLLVPLFLTLLVVTSFQAQYRGHFRGLSFNFDAIDWSEVPQNVLPRVFTGKPTSELPGRGSEFDMTAAVVKLVPEQVPYALGVEFLQFFTHPIPRALWPDKRYPRSESWTPIHLRAGTSSYWVTHVAVPFIGGPSPAFVASWYYNGGPFGLVIGGLIVGILFRAIRGIYDRSLTNQSDLVIYLLLAPLGFREATSHPFDWIYTLPLVLVPLAFLLYLSRARRKRNRKETRYHIQQIAVTKNPQSELNARR